MNKYKMECIICCEEIIYSNKVIRMEFPFYFIVIF